MPRASPATAFTSIRTGGVASVSSHTICESRSVTRSAAMRSEPPVSACVAVAAAAGSIAGAFAFARERQLDSIGRARDAPHDAVERERLDDERAREERSDAHAQIDGACGDERRGGVADANARCDETRREETRA